MFQQLFKYVQSLSTFWAKGDLDQNQKLWPVYLEQDSEAGKKRRSPSQCLIRSR